MNIDDYRKQRSDSTKTSVNNYKKPRKMLHSFINRIMLTIIVFLIGMIFTKNSATNKKIISEHVYEESIHFSNFKKIYNKYFGKYIGEVEETKQVFTEKLSYSKESVYKDGVKLTVSDNYLVPALESGIVIFIGNKEGYGNTVIIEQINGIDVWYSNITEKNIKMYDYVKKGDLIGEAKDKKIYLLFEEKGKFLDYKKYI